VGVAIWNARQESPARPKTHLRNGARAFRSPRAAAWRERRAASAEALYIYAAAKFVNVVHPERQLPFTWTTRFREMNRTNMRRGMGEALISIGALAILMVALVSIDPRVRDHVLRAASEPSVSDTSARISSLGSDLLVAARDQTVAHAPLAIFVAAGVVLFLFMVRT
jgi:hypothetical protein